MEIDSLFQLTLNNKNRKHKMKTRFSIIITTLLAGCGSIGSYTENQKSTQVSFSEYSTETGSYLNQQASLKVAETGLVSGSTLLYSALGRSSRFNTKKDNFNVTYPLWINESEIDEVELAINEYRHWRAEVIPRNHSTIEPINEYVSEWMQGVTFKFGLYNSEQGKAFLSICYEFSKSGVCTFTYMIDEQSVELLSDDLNKFKQNLFDFDS
jgi:hypothetical protein